MDSLDTGKDKIKKICDVLVREALDPAKEEAAKCLQEARENATQIIEEAKKRASEIVKEGYQRVEAQRQVVEHALRQASAQTLESLKQTIEEALFTEGLVPIIEKMTSNEKLMGTLTSALVNSIEKEGISADFSLVIGKALDKETFLGTLAKSALKSVEKRKVIILDSLEGIQLKLHDKKFTLDFSQDSLCELISQYLRKDFRQILFKEA